MALTVEELERRLMSTAQPAGPPPPAAGPATLQDLLDARQGGRACPPHLVGMYKRIPAPPMTHSPALRARSARSSGSGAGEVWSPAAGRSSVPGSSPGPGKMFHGSPSGALRPETWRSGGSKSAAASPNATVRGFDVQQGGGSSSSLPAGQPIALPVSVLEASMREGRDTRPPTAPAQGGDGDINRWFNRLGVGLPPPQGPDSSPPFEASPPLPPGTRVMTVEELERSMTAGLPGSQRGAAHGDARGSRGV